MLNRRKFITHLGSGLTAGLTGLAGLLKGLYDAAKNKGVMRKLTVVVMTEFGRTTFENGTSGTDHGYGGVAMVMSTGVRAPVVPTGWFPTSGSGAFYDSAESVNVLPRLIEHRQVLAEVLRSKLEITDITKVLPSFVLTAGPRLFR